MNYFDPLRTFFLALVCKLHHSLHVMRDTPKDGRGDSAAQYQDGQVIRLPKNWKMSFVMNWDAETPYLQGFVLAPDGKNSASLACARDMGTTSCDEEIELPHVVHAFIMREEFDEYA